MHADFQNACGERPGGAIPTPSNRPKYRVRINTRVSPPRNMFVHMPRARIFARSNALGAERADITRDMFFLRVALVFFCVGVRVCCIVFFASFRPGSD